MDLKKYRVQKSMSQAELAKRAGMAQSAICYLETGQKNPSIKTMEKLAKALDISLTELLMS